MTDMSEKQIAKALAAGIIDQDQADALRAKISGSAEFATETEPASKMQGALIGDEEDMRFVRSFSDMFIAIGIGLLSLGLFATLKIFGGGVMYLLGAGLMWLMCEYFGRKKRAHLPTLLLAIAYLLFVHRGLSAITNFGAVPAQFSGVVPALITLAAMLLFYWRFRLPFSVALIALSLIIVVFSVFGASIPTGVLMVLSGLGLFITAIVYDTHDTGRKTRFADNAFWLHLTAAPLIMHGIAVHVLSPEPIAIFGFIPMVQLGKSDAIFMLIIIGILALVALAINRRALLVSSLGYAGFALGFLIKDTGLNFGSVVALTLLLLGGAIVFLGVGWHAARRPLLAVLPAKGILAKVFPPSIL